MRRLRRLPPLPRVAAILGLLLPVAALIVISLARFSPLFQSFQAAARLNFIAIALVLLGLGCTAAQLQYTVDGQQASRLDPLASWPRQLLRLLLLTALPLCALVLAALMPLTPVAFDAVFALSVVGALPLFVAMLVGTSSQRVPRLPRIP